MAFSFNLSSANEKLPGEDMSVPKYMIILNNFNRFVIDTKIRVDAFLSTFMKDNNFSFFQVWIDT